MEGGFEVCGLVVEAGMGEEQKRGRTQGEMIAKVVAAINLVIVLGPLCPARFPALRAVVDHQSGNPVLHRVSPVVGTNRARGAQGRGAREDENQPPISTGSHPPICGLLYRTLDRYPKWLSH